MSTVKTTASYIELIFLDSWIYTYGIPRYVRRNNGPQFGGRFCSVLCGNFGCEKLETTAYYPQTKVKTERYTKPISTTLRGYVSEHQSDWYRYVQPLTDAYHNQVCSGKAICRAK